MAERRSLSYLDRLVGPARRSRQSERFASARTPAQIRWGASAEATTETSHDARRTSDVIVKQEPTEVPGVTSAPVRRADVEVRPPIASSARKPPPITSELSEPGVHRSVSIAAEVRPGSIATCAAPEVAPQRSATEPSTPGLSAQRRPAAATATTAEAVRPIERRDQAPLGTPGRTRPPAAPGRSSSASERGRTPAAQERAIAAPMVVRLVESRREMPTVTAERPLSAPRVHIGTIEVTIAPPAPTPPALVPQPIVSHPISGPPVTPISRPLLAYGLGQA